jgi:hypothetical protein
MFASGHVVDLILVLIGAEALLISAFRHWAPRRVSLAPFAWTLASGASLLLALRASLVSAAWFWVAGCLVAALITHLVDLSQRLR